MSEGQRSFELMEDNLQWLAVYTRPRWEKKVAESLSKKGIDCYCPLNRVRKQWSDRKKIVLEPLFKGYVFVHVAENRKWDIKQIDGILNYVYWLGRPAKVHQKEIDTIKRFLQEFEDVDVVDTQLDIQSEVVIKSGVLMNYRGIVLEITGGRARVKIDSMGIQLSALFSKNNLELAQPF